jgi:hypothetical protein
LGHRSCREGLKNATREKTAKQKAVWEGKQPLPQTAFCKNKVLDAMNFHNLGKGLNAM